MPSKKIHIFILTLILITGDIHAQDPHFSQFFVSPLALNPAYAGKFDGTYRFSGNFKKQWPLINNAFTSGAAAIDFPLLSNRITEMDTWGVGLMAINDRSGNGILNNSFYSISTAYTKSLDENGFHQITLGFQGSFASKRLNLANANLEDELTAFGFTGVTSESFNGSSFSINYADLNAGFMYALSTNGQNSFFIGTSVYHINRPAESFNAGNYLLNPRTTIHGGGYLPSGINNNIHFSFMHQVQGASSETLIGGAYSTGFLSDTDRQTEIHAGLWIRVGDAVIPYLGAEFNQLRIGISHDINFSGLTRASYARGGSELSIIYTGGKKDPLNKKIHCPKF
jgi:type IX secretion system PorP/SprF family membrane protein